MAYRNFKKLGDKRIYRKIVDYVTKKLNKINDPISKAKFVHKNIEKYNSEILSDPVVKKHLSCKKGCSACCHTQVSITDEEASLLADQVINGIEIDIKKLYIQKEAESSASKWYAINYENRGCVFLDDNGACRVYENRPSVCRTNNVVSSPELCSTEDGVEKSINLLNTFSSDMVTYAAFKHSKKTGVLASLLWQKLSELGKTPSIYQKKPSNNLENL